MPHGGTHRESGSSRWASRAAIAARSRSGRAPRRRPPNHRSRDRRAGRSRGNGRCRHAPRIAPGPAQALRQQTPFTAHASRAVPLAPGENPAGSRDSHAIRSGLVHPGRASAQASRPGGACGSKGTRPGTRRSRRPSRRDGRRMPRRSAPVLDRPVADAAPRSRAGRAGEGIGGAGVEAPRAGAAVVRGVRRVGSSSTSTSKAPGR